MREILFRGKTIKCDDCLDDGQRGLWVYGNYYLDECGVECIAWYDELDKTWNIREIEPCTIGQFTGFLDCNGNKIFEGDILQEKYIDNEKIYLNVVEDIRKLTFAFPPSSREYIKIIGNIHDNPELLE